MTEIKTIQLSVGIWRWLYENPLKWKREYPKYKSGGFFEMTCECPCCEYYEYCAGCPLIKIESITGCINTGCIDAFGRWHNAVNEGDAEKAEYNSKIILNVLEKKLAELEELK